MKDSQLSEIEKHIRTIYNQAAALKYVDKTDINNEARIYFDQGVETAMGELLIKFFGGLK